MMVAEKGAEMILEDALMDVAAHRGQAELAATH
jgi:choline dehydrogenase